MLYFNEKYLSGRVCSEYYEGHPRRLWSFLYFKERESKRNNICIRKKQAFEYSEKSTLLQVNHMIAAGIQSWLCTDNLDSEATSKLNRASAMCPASSMLNVFVCLCAVPLYLWTLERTLQSQNPHFRVSADSAGFNSCSVAITTPRCVSISLRNAPFIWENVRG